MEQTWKCSGNDLRKMPLQIWEEDLSILSNAEAMKRVLLAWKQIENRKEIVVPLVQNIEGAVLGAGYYKEKKLLDNRRVSIFQFRGNKTETAYTNEKSSYKSRYRGYKTVKK